MPRYKSSPPMLIERRMNKAACIRMRLEDYLFRAVGVTITADDVEMILRSIDTYASALVEAQSGHQGK